MRSSLLLFPAVALLSVCCYDAEILGLIEPDTECAYSVDGELRDDGILDVGPTGALTHSYEAVLLIDGDPGDKVTSASVAFGDADGDRLPNTEYGGEKVVFPSVEGERHSKVKGTLDDNGRGAVPFTLVTAAEAAPLQNFTAGGDFVMRVEVRAVVDGRTTVYPYFVELTLCEQCLVGVGAEVQDDALACPGGSPPAVVDEEPCRKGQDDVYSTCPDM
jgi:hypothetical protein